MKKKWLGRIKHIKVKWLVPYFVDFNRSFFEISLTFISSKPSPKPSDVQLLSTRHVTKVHLLQKFLDPKKHLWSIIHYQHVETFLDSHSHEKCVYKGKCVSTLIKGKHDTWLARGLNDIQIRKCTLRYKFTWIFSFFILARRNN
jgi:hypothetical protein